MPTTIDDTGPYSSIFDYKEEAAKEEEKRNNLAESQRKIMRTNAVGDAFRLLIDGVGGSAGATITPKAVNPGIVNACSRLDSLKKEGDARMERLKVTDLAGKRADIEHKLRIDAEKRAIDDRNDIYDKTRDDNITDRDTQQKNAKDLITFNTNEDIRGYQEKIKSGIATPARTNRKVRYEKEDVEFTTPDTNETIFISKAEISQMQYELTKDKTKYDPDLDDALEALMKNEAVKDESAILVLKRNWDKVKRVLPEYANQPAAEPAPLTQAELAYNTGVYNVMNNTGLSKSEKIKRITKLNVDYKGMTEEKADFEAEKRIKENNIPIVEELKSGLAPKDSNGVIGLAPDSNGVTDVSSIFK